MEIERQFLVTDVSQVPVNMSMAKYEITQGYLSFEPELRIRQMNDEYFLTFKSAGGLVRREEEIDITKKDFENLLPRVQGTMLRKVRHEILLSTGELSVFDIYGGELDGFCMAEVEFSSAEEAKAFDPPVWFGKEITYDARLTAANLVQHGWKWFADILDQKTSG